MITENGDLEMFDQTGLIATARAVICREFLRDWTYLHFGTASQRKTVLGHRTQAESD